MRGWYAGEYTSMRTVTPAQVQVVETDPGGLHGFPAVCLPQVFPAVLAPFAVGGTTSPLFRGLAQTQTQ